MLVGHIFWWHEGLVGVKTVLQGVGEELVQLSDLGGDAKVDGALADLDDESADDVGVDLGFVR